MVDNLKQLVKAAHVAADGGNAVMKKALEAFYADLGEPVQLTERQRLVFDMSLQDKTLEEIAKETGNQSFTIRRDSKNINDKFGVKNRHAALLQFMRLE